MFIVNEPINFSTFLFDSVQALAMIYLNSLDLTGKSPEDIVHIYRDAYERIEAEQEKISKESDDGSIDKWINSNQW